MLGSSGKCLNHFCIVYSRYLASSTGNEFSIWKRVTECPRQEVSLGSLSVKTDPGSLNTPTHFLRRITAAAASWTCFSFTHSSPLLRQAQSPSILQDSSEKSHFSYSRDCFSSAVYQYCALHFLKCFGRYYFTESGWMLSGCILYIHSLSIIQDRTLLAHNRS